MPSAEGGNLRCRSGRIARNKLSSMTTSPAKQDSALLVLTAIRRIVRKVAQHSHRLSQDTGLTVPQLLCLKAIGDMEADGEVTAVQVANRLQLSPATVSRILDRLERAGLVDKARSTADRRRVHLTLSAQGKASYEAQPAPLQEQFVERFSALPKAQQESLLHALETLSTLMDASELDASPILAPESSLRSS